MMSRSMLLICIVMCSAVVCQAQNVSTTCNCTIKFSANQSQKDLICFENVCKELEKEELGKILQSKEEMVNIDVVYTESNTDYEALRGDLGIYVIRLTYIITIDNNISNPTLNDVTLEAKLCDNLVYESSEYLESDAYFYEPSITQNNDTHTTSKVNWWIGTLMPGEKRRIGLDTLYNYQEPPSGINKTKFLMTAKLWGKDISKNNIKISQIE
jgi:hypothetical protein